MNTRLLRKIEKHISEEPTRLIMRDGLINGSDIEDFGVTLSPPCGTAACIAGTAYLLSPKTRRLIRATNREDGKPGTRLPWFGGLGPEGQRLLGLKPDQAANLFRVEDWPYRFAKRFRNAKTPKTRAAIAVARIEHFIKTKGKE